MTKSLTVCGSLGICIEMQFSASSRLEQTHTPPPPHTQTHTHTPPRSKQLNLKLEVELELKLLLVAVAKFLSLLAAHNFRLRKLYNTHTYTHTVTNWPAFRPSKHLPLCIGIDFCFLSQKKKRKCGTRNHLTVYPQLTTGYRYRNPYL